MKICYLCNKEFKPKFNNQKRCNNKHHFNCVVCNNSFEIVSTGHRKTCSRQCANKLRDRSIRKSNMKKYGYEYPLQSKEVRNKCTDTLEKRFGVRVPCKSKEIQENLEKTNLERYGAPFTFLTKIFRENNSNSKLEKAEEIYNIKDYLNFSEFVKNNNQKFSLFELARYFNIKSEESLRIKINNHNLGIFIRDYFNLTIFEQKILDYLIQNTKLSEEDFIYHSYKIITPQEIDLYIPKLKIGIEVSPSYTHQIPENMEYDNIGGKTKYYHQKKTLDCYNKGLRLLTIFDWTDYTDVLEIIHNTSSLKENLEFGIPINIDINKYFIIEPELIKYKDKNKIYKVWNCGTIKGMI